MSTITQLEAGADSATTFVDVLRLRAFEQPQASAYTFLVDGERHEESLAYAELDARARAVAAVLQKRGAVRERVLIILPPGLAYITAFFGCLYAGAVAVPVYPPSNGKQNRVRDRFLSIRADAQPAALIGTAAILELLAPLFPDAHRIPLEGIDPGEAADWQAAALSSDDLALLQYTSGSTSAPKGAMVSHGNLLHNQRTIRALCGHTHESTFVGWLPLYHDMGLIGNVLQPLYLGARCVLMSPTAFLQKPVRWLDAISRYRAHTSGGPNFAYDLCARKVTDEQRARLDLASWRVAFNGAEPIRAETLALFSERFADCGFSPAACYPCYGMAEATLMVTGSWRDLPPTVRTLDPEAFATGQVVDTASADRGRLAVSSGRPGPEIAIVIVDPDRLEACPPDRIGEIWISGPSVGQGYWNRPEETTRTFRAKLADGRGPYLRTGDLGFLREGQLYVTGRLKDLIIVRGRNCYPEDLEITAERADPRIRRGCCAAFGLPPDDEAGDERIVVAVEVDRATPADAGHIVEAIRQAIAEQHQLQVYAVVLLRKGGCPKTTSGKIQRSQCRRQFMERTLDELARGVLGSGGEGGAEPARCERYLRRAASAVLKVPERELDSARPLAVYGLDSLGAVQLRDTIETDWQVSLPGTLFLDEVSIGELARLLDAATAVPAVARVERADTYPLSYSQRALWLHQRIAPHNAAYNLCRALRIRSALDVPALERALQAVALRHDALRTTFETVEGEPVQRIHARAQVSIQEEDASDRDDAWLLARLTTEAQRPFDLERGPLLRVQLFRHGAQDYTLCLSVHHIVADFPALAVLLGEWVALYEGRLLAPVAAQYPDYTRWQLDLLTGGERDRLDAFWRAQLQDVPGVIELAGDRARPPVQSHRGGLQRFTLSAEISTRVAALAQAHQTTRFTVLLAMFQLLLLRLSGQTRFIVGTPVLGRPRAAFAQLVGHCVNIIPIVGQLEGNPPFQDLLARTRATVLAAFAHDAYPFVLLVEQLRQERDASRAGLTQMVFVWQQAAGEGGDELGALALGEGGVHPRLGALPMESIAFEAGTAQRDLTLLLTGRGAGISGALEFNADIFDAATAARLVRYFQTLVENLTTRPDERLWDAALLTPAERQQIVHDWNATDRPFPRERLLQGPIEEQAARQPGAVAVLCGERQLTYGELNAQANRIAGALREAGIRPGQFVGLFIERSAEMIAAVLGVIKSGAAYVPVEVAYPSTRIEWILRSLDVSCVVTSHAALPRLRAIGASLPALRRVICLGDGPESVSSPAAGGQAFDVQTSAALARFAPDDLAATQTADDLAYVIFTSGSTGTPKGVMVTHRPVANVVDWVNRTFEVDAGDRVLLVSSLCFDLSVYDIFGLLSAGGSIRVASADEMAEPERLVDILRTGGITFWDSAPAALQQLAPLFDTGSTAAGSALRLVFLSGDWIPLGLPDQVRRAFPGCTVVGLGGATEATVWSNSFVVQAIDPAWSSIPYGVPIQNARYHVLDRQLGPCPIGVPGLLHIGGECLSSGYINEPGLTAGRFIPDPFGGVPGGRLYDTGDLVRYGVDGTMEFLGRRDGQVKIRGFRIELGEIEAALSAHPGVRAAAVIVEEPAPRDKRLTAFVVPRGEAIAVDELRAYLLARLPEYMVPPVCLVVEGLPVTSNGKLDRAALRTLARVSAERADTYEAPRTPIEATIAAICAEVLGVPQVGLRDNFFTLGGHSLMVTRAVAAIRARCQVDIPVAAFLQAPSVVALAATVSRQLEQDEAARRASLASVIEALSDGEVRALLRQHEAAGAGPELPTPTPTPVAMPTLAPSPRPMPRPAARLQAEQVSPHPAPTAIRSLGYLTSGRPQLVERGVGSYLAHLAHHERRLDVLVIDDSRTPDHRRACKAALVSLGRAHGVAIRYAGRDERTHFADALQRHGGFLPELVRFALLGEELGLTTAGGSRNTLLLDTVGDCVLSVDDDTICQVGTLAGRRDGVRLTSTHDAVDVYPHADRTSALQAVTFTDDDWIGMHERVLGADVRTMTDAARDEGHPVDEPASGLSDRLERRDAQVAMTLNGYIGDCGWGSPTNYLLLAGASLDRLVASEAAYRAACVSREMLQLVDRLTVSDGADFAMMAFAGLDNRALLPPFVPVGRAQDNLFGAMLTRAFPDTCVAHLPWGLVHAPGEARAFWEGEVTRSASGIDLPFLLTACLRSYRTDGPRDRAQALRGLGRAFLDIGELPAAEFDLFVRLRVSVEIASLLEQMERRVEARGGEPAFWAKDVRRFVDLVRGAMARPEYTHPLDLLYGRDPITTARLSQQVVRNVGALLSAWPDMVAAASQLRQRGVRVARALEVS